MDYLKAMDIRCSRRRYVPLPLKERDAAVLRERISEYNAAGGLHMELVVGNGDAFDGFKKSYGLFSGVKNYIIMAGKREDPDRHEKEGYYGEKLVLEATDMGLATCWIGSSYDRESCDLHLAEDEVMDLVIAIGYSEEKWSLKEKMMTGMMRRNGKSMAEILRCELSETPDWFQNGMQAVMKAPTAKNLMPVAFDYKQDGSALIYTTGESERIMVDVGIVKLHFELGAGNGRWDMGNSARFVYGEV